MTNGQEPRSSNAYQLLSPGQLAVTRRSGVPKVRQCLRISRISPDIQIVPFNQNLETLRRAVAERVFLVKEDGEFKAPPKPSVGLFEQRLAPVRSLLQLYLPSTAPLSFADTIATFKGRKKARYERAYQNILFKRRNLGEEAKVSVFVKYEKTDRTCKTDPVPRVISPRSPEYNLRLARYLRKIEEPIFDALGELFGHKTVMKGVNTTQTAKLLREKWDTFSNPVAIGLDASRFDQHVSQQALAFEHTIYPLCFGLNKHRRKLKSLLKYQLRNKCSGYVPDGEVKYSIKGTRMSGDMNTSLGNCILMCMMVYAYAQYCGVKIHLANNGDDCVVFMEKRDEVTFGKNLDSWFRAMGFNMKVESPAYEFEHVEFCQTKPVFDGLEWVMCRNPWTAIAKDCVMLKHPRNVSPSFFKQWLDAIGTGGLALAGGLPIFQSFYLLCQRSGQLVRRNRRGKNVLMEAADELLPWYMREVGLQGCRHVAEVSAEARASFYFAFGITPEEQIETERYYDSMVLSEQLGEWHPRAVFPHIL